MDKEVIKNWPVAMALRFSLGRDGITNWQRFDQLCQKVAFPMVRIIWGSIDEREAVRAAFRQVSPDL